MPRKPKSAAAGRCEAASRAKGPMPAAAGRTKKSAGGSRQNVAAKASLWMPPPADPVPPSADTGRHKAGAEPRRSLPVSADTVDAIRSQHRRRCFAMEQRKRMDLALGSFLRLMLGWQRDLPEAERKRIAAQAADVVDDPTGSEWEQVVSASLLAREPFAAIEAGALKEMVRLAVTLPAWSAFGENIRGFGPASLAVIVAEAGDLSNYATVSKLWKRMGVAVVGDVRQGGLSKSAGKEAWIAHGYNRQRRSRLWNIGDALIKGNRDGKYRTLYLVRKEYELARDPEMAPIKAHRRAQRYMEKRLLKDLWRAWRGTIGPLADRPNLRVSPAPYLEAAE